MFWNDEESLNGCTAPSEVTRNALMRPRSVTKASVMPSANQAWSVSRDRSASGRTASERILAIRAPSRARPSQSPGFASNKMAATPATSGADHQTLGRPRVGGLERVGGAGEGGAGEGGAAGTRSGGAAPRRREAALSTFASAARCISSSWATRLADVYAHVRALALAPRR